MCPFFVDSIFPFYLLYIILFFLLVLKEKKEEYIYILGTSIEEPLIRSATRKYNYKNRTKIRQKKVE